MSRFETGGAQENIPELDQGTKLGILKEIRRISETTDHYQGFKGLDDARLDRLAETDDLSEEEWRVLQRAATSADSPIFESMIASFKGDSSPIVDKLEKLIEQPRG